MDLNTLSDRVIDENSTLRKENSYYKKKSDIGQK